jgi:hypothetical protein
VLEEEENVMVVVVVVVEEKEEEGENIMLHMECKLPLLVTFSRSFTCQN